MKKVPKQKPGKSKQNYETPDALLYAVKHRFTDDDPFEYDLACTPKNRKAVKGVYFDSLQVNWGLLYGTAWLNPPFANIGKWAEKLQRERLHSPYFSFLLVPASVGANWFKQFVYKKSYICYLNGRITFVGETQAYPKDCMLVVYGYGLVGEEVWSWNE